MKEFSGALVLDRLHQIVVHELLYSERQFGMQVYAKSSATQQNVLIGMCGTPRILKQRMLPIVHTVAPRSNHTENK